MLVEVFLLITGYFGTRFSVNKVAGLIYQMIFCVMVIIAVYLFMGKDGNRLYHFMFWGYWFINAYIGIVIFSPMINVALKHIMQRQFQLYLVAFYVIFGIGEYACGLFGGGLLMGYSLIWFMYMYLYMVGRYLAMYPPKLSTPWLLVVFLASLLGNTLLLFTTLGHTDFVNPFIILQSASLLVLFIRFRFKSKMVNYIVSSTLMVYLVSMHPCYAEMFKAYSMYDPCSSTLLFILKILAYCATVFVASIAFDKLRQLTWKPLSRPFQKLDTPSPNTY